MEMKRVMWKARLGKKNEVQMQMQKVLIKLI
jgi:hypothetical protein